MATGNLLPFRAGVRSVRVPMDNITFSGFGVTGNRSRCRPAGYLHKIWINLQGSFVVAGTSPTGAFLSYPFLPWSLLSKIRVFATPGTDLINISGDALAQYLTLSGYAQPMVGPAVSQFNNALDATEYSTLPTTSVTAGTYNFAVSYEVPISTDDSLLWGLLPLQNEQTLVYVELTFNTAANIHNIGGSGVTVTLAGWNGAGQATAQIEQEVFMVINDAQVAVPNLQFARKLMEQTKPITTTGDNVHEPIVGPVYLRQMIINENAGAQMANSNIVKVQYRFAQQVYIVDEPYVLHRARNFLYLAQPLPRGVVYFDWTNGQGIEGVVDTRDMVNTAQQTNVQIVENITGTLTNAQMRVIEESLVPL